MGVERGFESKWALNVGRFTNKAKQNGPLLSFAAPLSSSSASKTIPGAILLITTDADASRTYSFWFSFAVDITTFARICKWSSTTAASGPIRRAERSLCQFGPEGTSSSSSMSTLMSYLLCIMMEDRAMSRSPLLHHIDQPMRTSS